MTPGVVLTVGTFDVLHVGHLELLEACRRHAGPGGRVVVGLNTDAFIEAYRGTAPLCPYIDRERMLKACRHVDVVLENGQPGGSMLELVRNVGPERLLIGSDWLVRDYLGQIGLSALDLEELRCELVYVPRTTGQSSGALKRRITEGAPPVAVGAVAAMCERCPSTIPPHTAQSCAGSAWVDAEAWR